MSKEGLKSVVASFGYNRYIQNVVVDYFYYHLSRRYVFNNNDSSLINDSKYYFNLLKSKDSILRDVIPELLKSEYNG